MDKPKFIRFEKLIGETPKEALQRLRLAQPLVADSKLAYAGRLDPQATGELLVLVDDECKNRDHYQGLDKIYTFEILFGISSDTGDVMGVLTQNIKKLKDEKNKTNADLENLLQNFTGEMEQKYPVYSSKAVDGTPLWKYAKEGRLHEIEIPTHLTTIYSLELIEITSKKLPALAAEVVNRIEKVTGDFRQAEIIEQWRQLAEEYSDIELPIAKLTAKVSSGTYIRQLCIDIGETMETGALAWTIHRDSVIL